MSDSIILDTATTLYLGKTLKNWFLSVYHGEIFVPWPVSTWKTTVSNRTRRVLSNGLFVFSDRPQLVLIKLENRLNTLKSRLVVISAMLQSFLSKVTKNIDLTKFSNSSTQNQKNVFATKNRTYFVSRKLIENNFFWKTSHPKVFWYKPTKQNFFLQNSWNTSFSTKFVKHKFFYKTRETQIFHRNS